MFIAEACSDSKTTLFIKIEETLGLQEKAKVKMNGLEIGKLKKIYLDCDYKIIAEIIIDKGIDIPKDTKFRIYNEDILGTKSIELTPGIQKENFKNRDTVFELSSQNYPLDSVAKNIIKFFQKEEVSGKVDSLKDEIKRLNKNIDSLENKISLKNS
jgi:hypothetical protein